MKRLGLVALVGLCTSVGCGGTTPTPPGPVELALGNAAVDGSGFVPLEGDVALVAGAQGGFHVWVKYRIEGMGPGKADVTHTARRVADGRLVLTSQRRIDVGSPGTEGYWELPTALPAFMCPTPIGVVVDGQPIRYLVELHDEDGTLLGQAAAEATPHCPEGEQAAFCASICRG